MKTTLSAAPLASQGPEEQSSACGQTLSRPTDPELFGVGRDVIVHRHAGSIRKTEGRKRGRGSLPRGKPVATRGPVRSEFLCSRLVGALSYLAIPKGHPRGSPVCKAGPGLPARGVRPRTGTAGPEEHGETHSVPRQPTGPGRGHPGASSPSDTARDSPSRSNCCSPSVALVLGGRCTPPTSHSPVRCTQERPTDRLNQAAQGGGGVWGARGGCISCFVMYV